ncbi:MAG: hypothetical protein AAF478_05000 [Pseudomonadota bacterium]
MKIFPELLPAELGVLFTTLALILAVSPFASGKDFGVIKIPEFKEATKKRLKIASPLLIISAFAIYIPIPVSTKNCEVPVYQTVTDAKLCGVSTEKYEITPATPKSCRHQSFGQIGWKYTQEFTASSGWVRGGTFNPDWCTEFTNRTIAANAIAGNRDTEIIGRSERGRWTGTFGRTREYNYNCTIRIQWEAIYAEKTSAEVCGSAAAVFGDRSVPNTCEKEVGKKEVQCDALE